MAIDTVRLTNLMLAGLLTGNEVGTRVAVHPALDTLSPGARVEAERAVVGRYGRILPVVMPLTILSGVAVALRVEDRRSAAFRCALGAVASYAAMAVVTVGAELPINRRIEEASPQAPPDDFGELRRRWDRWHSVRVALDVLGLALTCAGALSPPDRSMPLRAALRTRLRQA